MSRTSIRTTVLTLLLTTAASLQGAGRFDTLISRVIWQNGVATYDNCDAQFFPYFAYDRKQWRTDGEYVCPNNGPRGNIGANPDPLVAEMTISCSACARVCPGVFGDPWSGEDGTGAYMKVNTHERWMLQFPNCSDGEVVTFTARTNSNVYDTSQLCSRPPEQSWCEAENFNPCSILDDWDGTTGQPDWETCECDLSESPILIDLSHNGQNFHLTDPAGGVFFDYAGDGQMEMTAWTRAQSTVAFLALDRNGDGVISNGKELFGNRTLQPDGVSPNGFNALKAFDGNRDDVIDSQDAVFGSLRLWTDLDHDGVSQQEELSTLAQAGVIAFSLDYRVSRRTDEFGNHYKYRARFGILKNGTVRQRWAVDVFFKIVRPADVLASLSTK